MNIKDLKDFFTTLGMLSIFIIPIVVIIIVAIILYKINPALGIWFLLK